MVSWVDENNIEVKGLTKKDLVTKCVPQTDHRATELDVSEVGGDYNSPEVK